jgi:diketogulonate reductase-like aldo/keto reductase
MGESPAQRDQEVAAIRHALDAGCRIIDTAERYADGGADRVIASALKAFGSRRRSELFIVTKVTASNATRSGTVRACEASIRRMDCDYLDLYLLHSKGPHPFTETLRGFHELLQRGLVRHIGVSNFNEDQLQQWLRAEKSLGLAGEGTSCNQILYSAEARGIENGQLDWQRAHGIRTMAYSPLAQGRLARHPLLAQIGRERGATAAQIALAWCLCEPDVVAIVKSAHAARMEENLRAGEVRLTAEELGRIDQAFPLRLRWLRQNRWLRRARSTARGLLLGLEQSVQ